MSSNNIICPSDSVVFQCTNYTSVSLSWTLVLPNGEDCYKFDMNGNINTEELPEHRLQFL